MQQGRKLTRQRRKPMRKMRKLMQQMPRLQWPQTRQHRRPQLTRLRPMLTSHAQQAQQGQQQADSEKAAMRAQLSEQLNKILQTRDSARGLIVSMSDVLFDTGKYSLKPGAREKLAKVAGILIAYPGLNIAVGGYTDNVGGDEMNQKLSENRAAAIILWHRV
jgi:outer membrane protein OmpA-like peptidoglycan-associated protein